MDEGMIWSIGGFPLVLRLIFIRSLSSRRMDDQGVEGLIDRGVDEWVVRIDR